MSEGLVSCVVVFDLDDTLYLEKDYQKSGFQSVIDLLCSLYPVTRQVLEKIAHNGGDVIGGFANEVGYPSIKESLLWHYRLHSPNISLCDDVKKCINLLESKGILIAILTDGRSITQRQKLLALGLDKYRVFISEEYGGLTKPNIVRFQRIEKIIRAKKYIYLGDNPTKDFLAPNQLGWLTIGLCTKAEFIHQYDLNNIPETCKPHNWIENINKIIEYL